MESKEFLNVIMKRCSVRKFLDKPIAKEELDLILKAGMAAPSANNLQPWEFILITKRQTLDLMAESLPYAKMLFEAQAAIVVCGNLKRTSDGEGQQYWIQDCSAATENILLAIEALGLGAAWTAVYPRKPRIDSVVSILGIPDHIIPLNVIPIGHPSGEQKVKDKFKPEYLHYERY